MGRLSAQLGRQAEDRAAAFLQAQGYEILQRNFRGGRGEIDIICRKGGVIYFVEVKYRGADSWLVSGCAGLVEKTCIYGLCLQFFAFDDFCNRNNGFD